MTKNPELRQTRHWKRHLFYRKESVTTTWKLRLAVLICGALFVLLTRGFWIPLVGRSLICTEQIGHVDAILVENFDLNYLLFERAAEIHKAGLGARVLVPTQASSNPQTPNMVSKGVVEVMARVARLQDFEILPIKEIEPISLNAAYQIREYVTKQNIRSMIVVTSAFRSKRSFLIYQSVLGRAGVAMSCLPVFGQKTPETWAESWHGLQEVGEQFLKLQYYRFYVLPFVFQNDHRK